MDYRSLYLHFECAVWMYKVPIIKDIKEDFFKTLENSIEIDKEFIDRENKIVRLFQSILKLFAPLM